MVDFSLIEPPLEALMTPPQMTTFPILFLPVTIFLVVSILIGLLLLHQKLTKKAIPIALILLLSTFAVPANAIDYGAHLDTSNIMLFCYYKEPTIWTLSTTYAAFQTYTNHGSYIDGIIRVYVYSSGNTYTGVNTYHNVSCRIRADGWISTWMNVTQEESFTYFGNGMHDYQTALGRAINRVYYVASMTFPGYDKLFYYDFSRPTATRLYCVAVEHTSIYTQFFVYAQIPSAYSVVGAYVAWYGSGNADAGGYSRVYLDGTLIVNFNGHGYAYEQGSVPITFTTDVNHHFFGERAGDSDNALYFDGLLMVWVV